MPSETTTVNTTKGECEIFALQLAELADIPSDTIAANANSIAGRHITSCLRCQAELAQYRKLLRALSSLRGELMIPDEFLLEEVLAAVRPPASVRRLHRINYKNRKAAYIGGIAAAATGVTAGAFVIASRLAAKQRLAS